MNAFQDLLTPLARGEDLTFEEATRAFQIIMHGSATPAQMGAFLMGLRQKGETADELLAGAQILRARAQAVVAPPGTIDTCGTGGDARGTLNISTAVAIVVAACGVPVAKHGNRAVTSASGSADVLKALHVNIDADAAIMEEALAMWNIGFFYAPQYHHAARHTAPVRTELGLRTIFNLLGPLSNPARPKRQLLGVYDKKFLRPLAETLQRLDVENAWVVTGEDGVDEISITGPTHVAILECGMLRDAVITPQQAGLPCRTLDDIQGGDAEYNARAMSLLFSGTSGAYRDVVLLNSAACLIIAGKAADLKDGVEIAARAIDSGRAKETLAGLALVSNRQ